MDWLHPTYLWTLAAVPLAALLFIWAAWQRHQGLSRFGDRTLMTQLAATVSARRRRWKAGLIVLGVGLFALALAGPRYGTQLREVQREGVDLVIALDVSQSMEAQDVAPSRLQRAKNEIKKLIDELRGDRVGLVVFAGDAFIQCPLTTDYSAVRLFLDVADPSMLPTPGTDFGTALQKAIQAFESAAPENEEASRTKAVLFVSDGENHVANIKDLAARAQEANLKLFAAGVGETEGAPIPVYRNGRRIGYKRDRGGNIVNTQLQEAALKQLAADGAYFRIARTSSSLPQFPAALNRLERTAFDKEVFEEYDEQYQWPLALALLLLFGERLFSDRARTRRLTKAERAERSTPVAA